MSSQKTKKLVPIDSYTILKMNSDERDNLRLFTRHGCKVSNLQLVYYAETWYWLAVHNRLDDETIPVAKLWPVIDNGQYQPTDAAGNPNESPYDLMMEA